MFCWNLSSQVIYSYGNVQKLNVVENVFKCGFGLFFFPPAYAVWASVLEQQDLRSAVALGETDSRQVRRESLFIFC